MIPANQVQNPNLTDPPVRGDRNSGSGRAAPASAAPSTGAPVGAGGALHGPWRSGFFFEVPFAVRSKSNFRRSSTERRSEWRGLADFETSLLPPVRRHRPAGWELGDKSAAVAARPVVVSFIAARTLLDTANLDKSALDALEGELFHTDASVRSSQCVSVRTGVDQRAVFAFAQLTPGASLREVVTASQRLAVAVVDLAGALER